MPVSSVERPVSALRQRMLEDMAMRGLRSHTQRDYVRFVRSFAAFLGRSPDAAQAEDIRRFQVHQRESGVQPPTINGSVSALRFFFTVTLDRPDLSRRLILARFPRKLPAVQSVEEVGRLLEAAPGIKYKAILGSSRSYCVTPRSKAWFASSTSTSRTHWPWQKDLRLYSLTWAVDEFCPPE
jgi:integrase/recombinase XerD